MGGASEESRTQPPRGLSRRGGGTPRRARGPRPLGRNRFGRPPNLRVHRARTRRQESGEGQEHAQRGDRAQPLPGILRRGGVRDGPRRIHHPTPRRATEPHRRPLDPQESGRHASDFPRAAGHAAGCVTGTPRRSRPRPSARRFPHRRSRDQWRQFPGRRDRLDRSDRERGQHQAVDLGSADPHRAGRDRDGAAQMGRPPDLPPGHRQVGDRPAGGVLRFDDPGARRLAWG